MGQGKELSAVDATMTTLDAHKILAEHGVPLRGRVNGKIDTEDVWRMLAAVLTAVMKPQSTENKPGAKGF